jgi:hypothetical protein
MAPGQTKNMRPEFPTFLALFIDADLFMIEFRLPEIPPIIPARGFADVGSSVSN